MHYENFSNFYVNLLCWIKKKVPFYARQVLTSPRNSDTRYENYNAYKRDIGRSCYIFEIGLNSYYYLKGKETIFSCE